MSEHVPFSEAPAIELVPMNQRLNIKSRNEDWTGKSDTVIRRKLQNRLNQRASRRRRKQGTEEKLENTNNQFSLQSNESNNNGLFFPNSGNYYSHELVQRPSRPTSLCVPQMIINPMVTISCFDQFQQTPLHADQKLLTLMHFNLIRALCQCVDLLGFTPDEMYLDVPSPFVDEAYQVPCEAQYAHHQNRKFESLPPTMQPTALQKTVPHHPEIDLFPFPTYRDNLILAGKEINDVELCMDVCYGVAVDPIGSGEQDLVEDSLAGSSSGPRTGFIVWSDPWLQSSWEVEEGFARKYRRLFEGCDELLTSTNYWREQRGEPPLDLGFRGSTSLP